MVNKQIHIPVRKEGDNSTPQKELFTTKVCEECGSKFIVPTGDWIYKITKGEHYRYFCSYSCWRKNGGDE